MAKGASERTIPASLLEVFSGLDTIVTKGPEEQVDLGDGFSILDRFPDCRVWGDVWET
jgi:hypothetical protein